MLCLFNLFVIFFVNMFCDLGLESKYILLINIRYCNKLCFDLLKFLKLVWIKILWVLLLYLIL